MTRKKYASEGRLRFFLIDTQYGSQLEGYTRYISRRKVQGDTFFLDGESIVMLVPSIAVSVV